MPTKSTFSSEVKDLFFRADINGSYYSNLKYYRTVNYLKETEPRGYTIYPPLSALGVDGRDSSFHSFQFDLHPYAPAELDKGILNVSKRGYARDALTNFTIYYFFKSRLNGEKIYQSLVDKFSGLATNHKSSQLQEIKYSEFFDTTSHLPGLHISWNSGNDEFTLTISVIR